jgi:hypothetical protein
MPLRLRTLGMFVLLSFALPITGREGIETNPAVPEAVGVNIHFTDPRPGEMEMLAASGVRWVRTDFSWDRIEKARGQYDFADYDRLIVALEANGIRPLFILCYANPLYDGGMSPHSEDGRQAFANWVAASLRHFQGRGILWEMYNEPNVGFWRPKPNVDDYIQLALAVGETMFYTAPGETYIGPATSGIDLTFLEACFKAGLLNYWSAVSVHPYRQQDPETSAEGYRNLRVLIAKYTPAGRRIPIISSEWGYSSTWDWRGMSEEKQGELLVREWLTNLSNDVPLSIWYDWRDDSADPANPEFHFGTVHFPYRGPQRPVYSPKPAYSSMQSITTLLNGFRFDKRLSVSGPEDYVLLFKKGDNVRLAAWSTSPRKRKVAIPASPGRFLVTGSSGKPLPTLTAGRRGLSMVLTNSPQFLMPEKPNELLQVAAGWERLPLEITTHAPQRITITLHLRNPLARPIALRTSAHLTAHAEPHSEIAIPTTIDAMRNDQPTSVHVELEMPGLGRLAQDTLVLATNPLREIALPPGGGVLPVLVENPSAEAFRGAVELYDLEGMRCRNLSAPLELKPGETEGTVHFPLNTRRSHVYRAGLRVKDENGQTVSVALPVTVLPVGDFASSTAGSGSDAYALLADGDPKVGSEQTLAVAVPPDGPPFPGAGALRMTYRIEEGRKSLRVVPRADRRRAIEGRPRRFGLWVYGDGSGNAVFVRFVDATGQLFQEGGRMLLWKGWRFILFPLDSTQAAHLGGARDGVIHYPIRWDALFLLQTSGQRKMEGIIYISTPTFYY